MNLWLCVRPPCACACALCLALCPVPSPCACAPCALCPVPGPVPCACAPLCLRLSPLLAPTEGRAGQGRGGEGEGGEGEGQNLTNGVPADGVRALGAILPPPPNPSKKRPTPANKGANPANEQGPIRQTHGLIRRKDNPVLLFRLKTRLFRRIWRLSRPRAWTVSQPFPLF
jgi:hypothetical protein